jgi:hypothetical protein
MRIIFVQRTVKFKFNTYFHKDKHISKFTSVFRCFKSNFYFRNFFHLHQRDKNLERTIFNI